MQPPADSAAHEARKRPDATASDGRKAVSAKQAAGSDSRPSVGKQGKTGQGAAWQVAQRMSTVDGTESMGDPASTSKAADNQFAKFTPLSDAGPLWQAAAMELAEYATLVGPASNSATKRYERCIRGTVFQPMFEHAQESSKLMWK